MSDRVPIAGHDARAVNGLTKGPTVLSCSGEPPLVVDVDGTLLRTDLLWEGLVQLAVRHPTRLLGCLPAVLRGKAALKQYVAVQSLLDTETLPTAPAVTKLIAEVCAQGRVVVLASGAHETQVAGLAKRVGAELALGSDGVLSLRGRAKLERLRRQFGSFDYVGNDRTDLPLWAEARLAFGVGLNAVVLRRARRARRDLILLEETRMPLRPWFRALRPYQWAKNALLFLPALAAHLPWTPALALNLIAGCLAFSAAASVVYLVNDLADLPHDRTHPSKRKRPLAAGEISIPTALLTAAALAAAAAVIAARLPTAFQAILAAYLVLTTAYSFVLKKRVLVDVICLATLYTIRVVAGATLVDVILSRWFLAFSIFAFFSLALIKRVAELRLASATSSELIAGRGYVAADLPVLVALGGAATVASSLVYCLYITGDDVTQLYTRPDILWLGLPLLLYWQARVWLVTARGTMHEDPVVFALRDRTSYLTLGAFLFTVWLAT